MVKNEITNIICNGLSKYIEPSNVKCCPSNNMLRFIFSVNFWLFEISYFFMDDYYKIKIENNYLQKVIFLTKSKKFQRDIQLILKDLKLSKKSFANHVIGFTTHINRILDKYESLNYVAESYISDLNFDGILI